MATIVAIVQIVEWRRKQHFLTASYIEYLDSSSSTVVVAIANRGMFPTQLDYVAAGICNRLWRKPWRTEADSLCSMAEITDREGWMLGEPIDGKVLGPGEMVHVGMTRERIMKLRHDYFPKIGFRERPCIWIEHSQSDKPICVKIEFHD